jgi:hypothetical protein
MIVGQKGWLDGATFDDGIALCQAIPDAGIGTRGKITKRASRIPANGKKLSMNW